MPKLPSLPPFLAIGFLILLLYARNTTELQPLFLFPAIALAAVAVCYLWKRLVKAALLPYVLHAGTLGVSWALYLLYRNDLVGQMPPAASPWSSILLYVCMAFLTFLLALRLCRRISSMRKWIAVFLILYPASVIAVTPTAKNTATQEPPVFHFGDVVTIIEFSGLAPLHYEIYRYHTSEHTVSLPKTNLKLQSIILTVKNKVPNTAILEVIRKDGQVQYPAPRTVFFDGVPFEAKGETIDGQLVIISNDSDPYDWHVFYLLPSASHTLDNRSIDNEGSTN